MGSRMSLPHAEPMVVPTPVDIEWMRQEAMGKFAKRALAARIDEKILKILFERIDKERLVASLYMKYPSSVPHAAFVAFIDEHIVNRIRDAGWNVTVKKVTVTLIPGKIYTDVVEISESIIGILLDFPAHAKSRSEETLHVSVSKPTPSRMDEKYTSTVKLYRQDVCVICTERRPDDRYAMTCGHVNYCSTCAPTSSRGAMKCAVCRRDATLVAVDK